MDKRLTVDLYDNPIITIVWEDDISQFSKERKARVKEYFRKKYNTKNVNIITKANSKGEEDLVVDVSSDITDVNLQYNLIRTILESKNQMSYYQDILDFDKIVENKMIEKNIEVSHFRKWYIRKIRFSNFLSFGDNQEINYDDYSGLTVVESNPANTGGKSVLSVDLLLYLFFNTTTKSSKAEDIFNKYRDCDRVFVQGEIQIDGNDYIITRTIKRELNKSGSYSISSTLDINKVLPDGSLLNETGEQRRETEMFIKQSIGTIDDFLMTIMTTASNLEELLESKPTARGAFLSRFLGLEHIKKKEEIAKELFSVFSKTMISNVYNVEYLKQDSFKYGIEINHITDENIVKTKELDDINQRLLKGENYKDDLFKKKHSDIDSDLLSIKPEELENDILKITNENRNIEDKLNSVIIEKPSIFYQEEEHDKVKDNIVKHKVEEGKIKSKIDELESLNLRLSSGIECDHCGLKLMDGELNKKKLSELPSIKEHYITIKNKLNELIDEDYALSQIKKSFDEYEKNKLVRDKYQLSIDANNFKIENIKNKLEKYYKEQNKIQENKDLDSKIIKAKMRIDELVSFRIKLEKEINSNNNKIESLKSKIENNDNLIVKINNEFEIEKKYKIYLDLYGKNGISKLIMKTMLPYINSELDNLLEDSAYFRVEVRINDKNEVDFIMIDNNTGIEKLMSTGSGYERTISSLALRAVLSRVCSLPKPNIWIADEVFGKVSNEFLDLLGNFLVKLTSYFDKILLISFNPMVNNWANHVIKIEKNDNISNIIKN